MRVALGIEYDGAYFSGWQRQLQEKTVQQELEQALSKIASSQVRVHAAGRTDSGVHALAQVVHFDSELARPLNAWVRGVNSHLPNGISVLWARLVDEDFHARFSACSRSYRYLLLNQPVRPALFNQQLGWFFQPLDINIMRQAANLLLGTHDFSSFRASACQAKSPIKTLHKLEINKSGNMFCFDFSANAFLHHMVRNIVGALIYVGSARLSLDDFASLLKICNRSKAPPTFMPNGLYLTGVEYPAEYDLPSQAVAVGFMGSNWV